MRSEYRASTPQREINHRTAMLENKPQRGIFGCRRDAEAGACDVDDVLTGLVFAFRELEEGVIAEREHQELWRKLHE
ncbi:hypothetical protein BKG56_11810 [Mycobacteroides chelonae]|nr:hypothetical protein BKG56_11810 [Mycobacteroides chelonae]